MRTRLALGAVGAFAIAYGTWRILQQQHLSRPTELGKWLVAAVLLHDAVIVPLTLAIGFALTFIRPREAIRPGRTGHRSGRVRRGDSADLPTRHPTTRESPGAAELWRAPGCAARAHRGSRSQPVRGHCREQPRSARWRRDGSALGPTNSGRRVVSRVLVTGGAGFIGKHVVAALTARGQDVVVLDSLRADVHQQRGTPTGLDPIIGDVRDPDVVSRALAGVDVVCHLAAKVGLGIDVSDLPDYAGSNDHGTAVVLAAMAARGVTRLVLASSMVVYGEGRGDCLNHGSVTPGPRSETALLAGDFEARCPHCGDQLSAALVDENAPLDPRNAYAASKVAQEHYASAWARSTGGSVAAMRFHDVYGPGLPRDTPYAGVAAIFLSALRRGHPRPLRGRCAATGLRPHPRCGGGGRRCGSAAARGFTAYNVGSGTPRTVGQLATALASAVDRPAPIVTGQFPQAGRCPAHHR